MFVQEAEGLYRLRVPFENIATSVFLLRTPAGPVLYDCATTAEDVENVILPALNQLGIAPAQLHALVLSHAHGDHCGGMSALARYAPQMCILGQAPEKYAAAVQALMIGNSMKSDVLPALEAGAWGVFVPHGTPWALEHAEAPEDHPRYREIASIDRLPELINTLRLR